MNVSGIRAMHEVMRLGVLNPPLREPTDQSRWITVPPRGYGGVQWVVSHLIDGLLSLGHRIVLLGAPESDTWPATVEVVKAEPPEGVFTWLVENKVDVLHDHSNACIPLAELGVPFISTHHMTGRPGCQQNAVYLSNAQRTSSGDGSEPVVRIGVNPERFHFLERKEPFLLVLARVSRWKGVYEAVRFAARARMPVVIAGPSWEPEYLASIRNDFPGAFRYIGEVGGEERLRLIAQATAVLVFSRGCMGPWGDRWIESGATVVAEAAASGTPTISSDNGCLKEITPAVGVVIDEASLDGDYDATAIVRRLPAPDDVRKIAQTEWSHVKMAAHYARIYAEVMEGKSWGPKKVTPKDGPGKTLARNDAFATMLA